MADGRTLERGDQRGTDEELTTTDFETVHKDVYKEGGACSLCRVVSRAGAC